MVEWWTWMKQPNISTLSVKKGLVLATSYLSQSLKLVAPFNKLA
jgi:hypothetical protein